MTRVVKRHKKTASAFYLSRHFEGGSTALNLFTMFLSFRLPFRCLRSTTTKQFQVVSLVSGVVFELGNKLFISSFDVFSSHPEYRHQMQNTILQFYNDVGQVKVFNINLCLILSQPRFSER